jgi:oligoendopeptidase F
LIASGAFALLPGAAWAADDPPPTVWDLSDLFPTAAAWTAEYDALLAALPSLAAYKGRLGESAATLKAALQAGSDIDRRVDRLATYANLKADENLQDPAGQALRQKVGTLRTATATAVSWINPELVALGGARIKALIAEDPGLAKFRFGLLDLLRQAAHTLDAAGEALLALAGRPLAGFARVRSQLVLADIPWPTVTLASGAVRLDQQGFTVARSAPDRDDRRRAFDGHFGTFKTYESTLGAALVAQVNADVFRAKARRHPNALAAAMSGDNIPEGVYRTLIAATREGLPVLHRYFDMRRRMLGLQDLAYYDMYPPASRLTRKFDIATIRATVLRAVAPLGADYVALLARSTLAPWMDAFPRKGKAAGAYMNPGAYDVHPYLLLNMSDDYEAMSTYAHEWGHAMHSLLAAKAQPFETASYATFIAEIASTVNEQLLADYMYARASTKEEKLFYLDRVCELVRLTFYRQAMFGEFELAIHEAAEAGKPLSGVDLTATYYALLKAYHGPAVAIDPLYGMEWAVPAHFYHAFYVYQYATSLSAAVYFTDRILGGASDERDKYLDVLRAGGSAYPLDILKRAGLDMTTPVPYRALVAKLSRTLDEMEKLTG